MVLEVLAGACGTPDDRAPGCPSDLPAACPSPAPSWSGSVQAIVAAHCSVCHSPAGENPSRPFVTYEQVHAQRAGILTQAYACKMPPPDAGVAAPAGHERAQLLGWLVCGAPDN